MPPFSEKAAGAATDVESIADNDVPLVAPEDAPEAPEETGEENVRGGIPLRVTSFVFAVLAFLAAIALFISDARIKNGNQFIEQTSETYMSAKSAAMDLEAGSDYLTECVQIFVVTGDLQYLENYFEEVNETRQRDNALTALESLLGGNSSEAYSSLTAALSYSNELMEREYLAMRLMAEANRYDPASIPAVVSALELSEEDLMLTAEAQREKAQDLVFDEEYMAYKDRIREQINLCTERLIETSGVEAASVRAGMDRLMLVQIILLIALVLAVLGEVVFITTQIRIPLSRMVNHMLLQEPVPENGAEEMRFVTQTYNDFLLESQKSHQQLSYEATHDPLTGLLNRNAYEVFLQQTKNEPIALLIVDVDEFKSINDTYGHDVGDRILQRVAEILTQSFRSVDAVCRLGGDEFVVVMTRANSTMRQLVINKISRANSLLQNPQDDLPKISLSVGVAFSDRENPEGDIFKDADTALYRVKQSGRCGCEVFGSAPQESESM